jgi:hypothetical protein
VRPYGVDHVENEYLSGSVVAGEAFPQGMAMDLLEIRVTAPRTAHDPALPAILSSVPEPAIGDVPAWHPVPGSLPDRRPEPRLCVLPCHNLQHADNSTYRSAVQGAIMSVRRIVILTLAAAGMLACSNESLDVGPQLRSSASVQNQVHSSTELPFHGSLTTIESNVIAPPNLLADGTGQGTGTHLGRYTATFTAVVDLATGTSTGTFTFTAANGDQLFATFIGVGENVAPGVASLTEVATITGGTGRFAAATGTYTIRRIITFDEAGGATATGSFDGRITLKD